MFRFAQSSLLTVRMCRKKQFHQSIIHQTCIVVLSSVEFFINTFQFGMKKAQNHFRKPFLLNFQPFFEFVIRNIIFVNCFVKPGMRIGSRGAKRRNAVVVFIRNGKLTCFLRNLINLFIEFLLLLGIVFGFVNFKKFLQFVQIFLLFAPVLCSYFRRPLEHHMF